MFMQDCTPSGENVVQNDFNRINVITLDLKHLKHVKLYGRFALKKMQIISEYRTNEEILDEKQILLTTVTS